MAVTWSVMSVQTQKKYSAGAGNPAADKAFSDHVDDGDGRPKYRSEEHYDEPRSPFGEHGGSVQPDDQQQYANAVPDASRFEPADDVVAQVKCHQED